jgi:prepilin-type N-terminal cleavage/methylation domain-containing protein
LGRGLGRGFTLVELIVVVTILAILWLISFISIQWFSQEARDAKRLSDVRSLISKITIENTRWIEYSEIINEWWTGYKKNTLKINWEENKDWFQNTENPINRNVLKENGENFTDPTNNHPYPFAYSIWNSNWQWYNFIQLAYVEEKTGTTKLVWNYYEMFPWDSPSLFTDEYWDFIEDGSKDLIYNPWLPIPPKDCEPQTTEEGYQLITWILHKTSITLTKAWNVIEHWAITLEQDYQCNRSELEPVWEERTIVNCVNEPYQEYIPSGNSCMASLCWNTIPNNAEQNGQQTSGWEWHYSETSEQCAFKCIIWYTYEEGSNTCKQDCSWTGDWINGDWYKVPNTRHNETTTNLTKTETILWGIQTLQTTYSCNNGTFTKNAESILSVTCNTNYTAQSDKTCKANAPTASNWESIFCNGKYRSRISWARSWWVNWHVCGGGECYSWTTLNLNISNDLSSYPAFKACVDLSWDWLRRLPSRQNLKHLYSAGCVSTLSLVLFRYWSSTEDVSSDARFVGMHNGGEDFFSSKSGPGYVVCIHD